MSASMKFDNVAALQDYIRKFWPQLLTKLYHAFATGTIITPVEGVKGEMVLTEMILGTLVQRWKKTFDPSADIVDFKPRTLKVKACKVDAQFYPQELESNYLGLARRGGFKVEDFPYQAFIIDRFMNKIKEEEEYATWAAVEAAVPADGDPLSALFDGFLEIIKDELTAGSITAITTAAHTSSNAVENAEKVHAGLDPVYQQGLTYMFCSMAFARLYNQNYREAYGKYAGTEKRNGMDMIRLDFGDCYLVPTVGMGTSSRLICTPPGNLYFGYDAADDDSAITVEKNHRALDFMIDFKFGVQIGIVHDKILRVNNLT